MATRSRKSTLLVRATARSFTPCLRNSAARVSAAGRLGNGEILMLENTRFHPGEETNDVAFAKQIAALGLGSRVDGDKGIVTCDPLGYLEFLSLTSGARLILTDSGGLQEESTVLRIPCLTLRENTERPVTVDEASTCG